MARLKNGNLWLQHNTQQLSDTKTLSNIDNQFQFLDPNGANRDVLLPSASTAGGLEFTIANTANAFSLIVKDSTGTTTITTIEANEISKFVCNGIVWRTMGGMPEGFLVSSVTDGDTMHAPSSDAVYNILSTISGSTISGSGSGYITWENINSDTNAEVGHGYLINATSNSVTLTLPTTPDSGNVVGICDAYRMATTNNIVVDRNGNNIEGGAENLLLDVDGSGLTFTYVDSTIGWKIVSEIGFANYSSANISWFAIEPVNLVDYNNGTILERTIVLIPNRIDSTETDSPVTIYSYQASGLTTFTNTGATAEVIHNLPSGDNAQTVKGIVTTAYPLTFKAYSGQTIRYLSTVSISGGKVTSSGIGDMIELNWSGSQWTSNITGVNWQLETS